ncbi:alcohol dehydrogenase catalytic domain-containing protein [Promicromonospora iranensis]|uniref:Threonine dehydrogenase-like Zn-dependent dehydrogenase n=1 Tax=Promicromonospora iranensis TaxID=1105144 RepID=A0ABU2CUB9_9MICO|nr:alcohol dehydrogenase catalytic domain-containing protein [Promicromonospora iranensis]MDR7384925.1 threonine dehydrogenase-like Zn-dependent dehydrogenase [Promicromonospora iranensis]
MTKNLAIRRFHGASAVVDQPVPAPGPGEVVLAPEAVSLCGTDLQMLRGIRDDPSAVLGHEGACRVADVGPGVTVLAVGDRVTVNPTHPGDPTFLLGHNVEGLFQQRVRIAASAVAAGLLVPIGEDLDSATATLIEPLAITDYALDCLADASVRPGSTADVLAVLGDGLVGNLAAIRGAARGPWSRVVLAHTSMAGLQWSVDTWGEHAIEHVLVDDLPAAVGGDRLHALVATHRDRTLDLVDLLAGHLGDSTTAMHVTGGVPADARPVNLPGVDLVGVRAANTGGPWPPRRTVWESGERQIRLTGNRGVTSAALAVAAAELVTYGPDLAPLITHRTDLRGGADLMNRMVSARSRHIDDRLVVRLVVMVNPDLRTPAPAMEHSEEI